MITIRHAEESDRDFWFSLDRHLSVEVFARKAGLKEGYVIYEDDRPVGILRYNLFWDNTPFCTLIYVDPEHQRQGYGRRLMEHWEEEMRSLGFGLILTSTQADETAQHFYRKLGYKDLGGIVIDLPGYEQPTELILGKTL